MAIAQSLGRWDESTNRKGQVFAKPMNIRIPNSAEFWILKAALEEFAQGCPLPLSSRKQVGQAHEEALHRVKDLNPNLVAASVKNKPMKG